jgi:hypothetical protein
VQRLQKQELHHHQESQEALRAYGDEEVLQLVPQAHGSQGSEVVGRTFREQEIELKGWSRKKELGLIAGLESSEGRT